MNSKKETTKCLETKRLVLHSGDDKDITAVYEFDFRYLRSTADLNKKVKLTNDQLNEWYFKDGKNEEGTYEWFIYLKNSDKAIGVVIADREEEKETGKSIELSYNLHIDHWGKAYMAEALNTIIDYMINEVGYSEIRCGYDGDNTKSKRVIEKIGFEFYNVFHDKGYDPLTDERVNQYQYIMTKEMWNERRNVKR